MAKHAHRTPEQLIRDLEARIASIRARADRKEAKQNPAIRNALLAFKAIDKALRSDPDAGLRLALSDARAAITEGVPIEVRPATMPKHEPALRKRTRTSPRTSRNQLADAPKREP